MCFTQPISGAIALAGMLAAIAIMLLRRKWNFPYTTHFVIGLLYFVAMELLQFVQYFWMDDCGSTWNRALTWVAWHHIAWQPVFSNLMSLFFVADKEQRHHLIKKAFIPMSVIGGLMMSSRQFGGDRWPCYLKEEMCGTSACTMMGKRHIMWALPLRQPGYWTLGCPHSLLMFGPLLLHRAWVITFVGAFSGPVLAQLITTSKDEWESTWCFYSVLQVVFFFVYSYVRLRRSQSGQTAAAAGSEKKTK